MDTNSVDGWVVARYLWGILMSVLGFLGLNALRRITALERSTVSAARFKEEMTTMRQDRAAMHQENKEANSQTLEILTRIDDKIDSAERRRALVEHELAVRVEQVNTTAQLAVAAANNAANAVSGKYPRLEKKDE